MSFLKSLFGGGGNDNTPTPANRQGYRRRGRGSDIYPRGRAVAIANSRLPPRLLNCHGTMEVHAI